ncbi:hypothetical protein [Streptomyces fragilis]|nr:hypothetical protein [Streptomyces fragilis]
MGLGAVGDIGGHGSCFSSGDGAVARRPVSYTHLDVYKRQAGANTQ